MKAMTGALLLAMALAAASTPAQAERLKIASPQRGSWESAIPELGQKNGIFKKYGLELDITSTSGGGETLQLVISEAVDIGLSAGMAGVLGAYEKGAPIRIIGASSTGSRELFWYVTTQSPIQSMTTANKASIAYSTTGASTHVAVLKFINDYHLDGKPVGTGNPAVTLTQVKSGQVDAGWSVAPFQLDAVEKGELRIIGRASDIPSIKTQTVRVIITHAKLATGNADLVKRFMAAYRETVRWLYESPDAVPQYVAFSGFTEPAVRRMLKEFMPQESLQSTTIGGIAEGQQDAIQFNFIKTPLTDKQLANLIQIPAEASR
jgi:NitT/TauT family transport system substrate-binding protein